MSDRPKKDEGPLLYRLFEAVLLNALMVGILVAIFVQGFVDWVRSLFGG
jgi:hypothetical protein